MNGKEVKALGKTVIFLIDMNSFFVTCELLRHPEHKKKPLVIASRGKRSVISAASYAAKELGIDSAMPLQTALMKYNKLEIVSPDMEYYVSSSKKIMRFLQQFTTSIASASIDEAYLDVSHYFEEKEANPENILKLARFIQGKLLKELGFPCNIGISSNRFLAKMASELRKPFVLETIFVSEIEEKLWPLPVDMMHGVGKKSASMLKYLNIKTIGDFALFENEILLQKLLGNHILEQQQRARGIFTKEQEVVKEREHRISISHSRTFSEDVTEFVVIERKLAELWESVVHELGTKKVRVIKVFYKQSDFQTMQRSHTLKDYTDDYAALYKKAMDLFLMLWDGEDVRLVGIGVADMIERAQHVEQLNLFQLDKTALLKKVQQEKKEAALAFVDASYKVMTGKDFMEKRKNENGSKK